MDAASFWDMTYGEIIASINGYNKRHRENFQMQAFIAYRQADLIAALVAKVLGDKNPVPSIQDVFPRVFPEMPKQQQNWQVMKARIEEYAAAKRAEAKRNRGENIGDNPGGATGSDNGSNIGP